MIFFLISNICLVYFYVKTSLEEKDMSNDAKKLKSRKFNPKLCCLRRLVFDYKSLVNPVSESRGSRRTMTYSQGAKKNTPPVYYWVKRYIFNSQIVYVKWSKLIRNGLFFLNIYLAHIFSGDTRYFKHWVSGVNVYTRHGNNWFLALLFFL